MMCHRPRLCEVGAWRGLLHARAFAPTRSGQRVGGTGGTVHLVEQPLGVALDDDGFARVDAEELLGGGVADQGKKALDDAADKLKGLIPGEKKKDKK